MKKAVSGFLNKIRGEEKEEKPKEEQQPQPPTPEAVPQVQQQAIQESGKAGPGNVEPVQQANKEQRVEIKAEPQKVEQTSQQLKPEEEKRKPGLFDFLRYKTIKEEDIRDLIEELKLELIESDVSYEVTEKIANDLANALIGKKVSRSQDLEQVVEETLKRSIQEIMTKNYRKFDLLEEIKKSPKPYVIVFFGVNGVGKTTTIAKFAYYLKKNGLIPIIAASDTFRAAAQEQLAYHASKLEVPLIKGKYGGDPAAVAVDAINAAKSRGYQVVLVDTAGRMHVDSDLVEELKKIVRVSKPNLRLLVIDSLAGNDALEQAKVFDEKVGYDGVVLTKIDADVKGGIALSLAYELKKPVLFLGVGQTYDDLIPFDPDWFVKRLFE